MGADGSRARLMRPDSSLRLTMLAAALVAILAACSVAASPVPSAELTGPPIEGSPSPTTAAISASPSPSMEAVATPDPAACAAHELSERRCRAVVAWAMEQLPTGHAPVTAVELLADPVCGQAATPCARSGGSGPFVRVRLVDGTTSDRAPYCVGNPTLVCSDDPALQAHDLHLQGYWDIPCSGQPPAGCATPIVPDPSAVDASRPLEVASLDVPVGAVGHHEEVAGQAVIPNGILTEGRFRLANATQEGFLIDPGVVRLVLHSTDPTRPPFDRLYLRGRFPGTETVDVLLVYDVVETSPDAVLQVRDLVVR